MGYQHGAPISTSAETELAQAVEAHPRLIKLTFEFRQRHNAEMVERTLMHNRDGARRERQQTIKNLLQSQQESQQEPPATQTTSCPSPAPGTPMEVDADGGT